MAIHKLTVNNGATAGFGKYEDGYGPRQYVSESGAKKWVLRHTLHGRRRGMVSGAIRVSVWPMPEPLPSSAAGRLPSVWTPSRRAKWRQNEFLCLPSVPHSTSVAIGTAGRMPRPAAIGQHTQDLCKARHRRKASQCYHIRGHPADPLTELDDQNRGRQAGAWNHRPTSRLAEYSPNMGLYSYSVCESLPLLR